MGKKKVIIAGVVVTVVCIGGVWYLEKNYQISQRMKEKFGKKGLPGEVVTEPSKKEEPKVNEEEEDPFDDEFFDDVEPVNKVEEGDTRDLKLTPRTEEEKLPFNITVSASSQEKETPSPLKSKGVIFHSIEEMRENIDSFKEGEKCYLQIGNTSDVLEYVRTKDGFADTNPQSTDEGIPAEELSKSIDLKILQPSEEKTGTGKN